MWKTVWLSFFCRDFLQISFTRHNQKADSLENENSIISNDYTSTFEAGNMTH